MTLRYLAGWMLLFSAVGGNLLGATWWCGETLAESAAVGLVVLFALKPVDPK